MLSKPETRAYREQLLAALNRLDDQRADLKVEALRALGGDASGGLSNVPLHPADLGSQSSEEDVMLGLLENEEQLIAEVRAALDRLERGAFGRCEACDRPIARKRLHVLPYARHCTSCARIVQHETAPR
jgi:RNA polymerase-binding transcription factor DksA